VLPLPFSSPSSSASSSSSSPDCLKNDFQNAVRRNLQIWVRWRTQLNDNLVDAVMTGSQLDGVEPLGRFLHRDSPDPDHPTSNPKTLLTYSASTNLHTKDFYKYGIPRAKVDQRQVLMSTRLHGGTGRRVGEDYSEELSLNDVGLDDDDEVTTGAVINTQDDDDEELVFDYFNYQEKPVPTRLAHPIAAAAAAAEPSCSPVTDAPRRFHRSAATLPVAPAIPSDVKDRRISLMHKSKKSEQRQRLRGLQQQQQQNGASPSLQLPGPPSYVEPFVAGRMITARRDDVLYTHSAWHLDELHV
jgi:hypothetical protein